MTINIPIGIAFLAGLASFLSPCVFSLVPAYIGYLSGRSLADGDEIKVNRWSTLLHGVFFVLGFSIVFIALGLAFGGAASRMQNLAGILSKIGGVIVIFFGLHMTGILRIPFLEYDLRPHTEMEKSRSFLSSIMMGIIFSAGWTPCTGPTLGAILTMVWNGGSLALGAQLLSAYSIGLAIPFLVAAMGIGWVTHILKRYRKVMHYAEVFMGVILIIMGVLLILGIFAQIAQFGYFIDFGI